MSSKPTVTVKSVKYVKELSEETMCFTATVYVDGKRFCKASDRGHGGCVEFHPFDYNKTKSSELWADIKALSDDDDFDFEAEVNDAVQKVLLSRDIKKILRKDIAFMSPTGDLSSIKCPSIAQRTIWLDSKVLHQKYPEETVLNDMEFDAAVDLVYETINQEMERQFGDMDPTASVRATL